MNSVFLVGRLGADPELRRTGAGKCVCNLRLATERGGKEGRAAEHEAVRLFNFEGIPKGVKSHPESIKMQGPPWTDDPSSCRTVFNLSKSFCVSASLILLVSALVALLRVHFI